MLLTISLLVLIIVGLLLSYNGVHKKSKLLLFIGVIALVAPLFYFVGWTPFLPLVPVIAIVMTILVEKFVLD
ncbi:hypothetical protein [Alteribacter aurantiacus]|uniref:hypothetical protein n=1 Tax=Alteribacter aurantiacus TaxID=254410 RepID=UPI00041DF380|nr:hypothetical protein [Alteribacter aurantiacus]